MQRNAVPLLIAGSIVLLAAAFFFVPQLLIPHNSSQKRQNQTTSESAGKDKRAAAQFMTTLPTPIVPFGFISSFPKDGDVIGAVPRAIVLKFSGVLNEKSTVNVIFSGKDIGDGQTTIVKDKTYTYLVRNVAAANVSGPMNVEYKACTQTGCFDGRYTFFVDNISTMIPSHEKENDVKITLSYRSVSPSSMKIKAGTKVTWVNNFAVQKILSGTEEMNGHFYPLLNSQDIPLKDTYSFVFDKPGFYFYYGSGDPKQLHGEILVIP